MDETQTKTSIELPFSPEDVRTASWARAHADAAIRNTVSQIEAERRARDRRAFWTTVYLAGFHQPPLISVECPEIKLGSLRPGALTNEREHIEFPGPSAIAKQVAETADAALAEFDKRFT